jgi:HEAT repeat protein
MLKDMPDKFYILFILLTLFSCTRVSQKTWLLEFINRERIAKEEERIRIESLILRLASPDEGARASAKEELIRSGERAYPYLIQAIKTRPDLSIACMDILYVSQDKTLQDEMIKIIKDIRVPADARTKAVKFIGHFADKSMVFDLIRIMPEEKCLIIKKWIIYALGESKIKEVLTFLKNCMQREPPALKTDIVKAIGKIATDDAVDYLIKLYEKAPDHYLREKEVIIDALISTKKGRAISFVVEKLRKESSRSLRAHCAGSLKGVKNKRVMVALVNALLDESEAVFHNANESLSSITGVDNLVKGKNHLETRLFTHERWKIWLKAREIK